MKTEMHLSETIDRFRRVFWGKESGSRPPVAVVNPDMWLPAKYLRREFEREYVIPDDVRGEMKMTDYEFAFSRRPVPCDDWISFSAPWRAIPWLEACCGCRVRYSTGSLAPEHFLETVESLAAAPVLNDEWFLRLDAETAELAADPPGDCWISPTILRGPSDVLAAMRGLINFFCDIYDRPRLVDEAAGRINKALIRALDRHFARIRPKAGGYGHIFGYWAPGPTIAIQEDALGMCNPAVYREIFMRYTAEVVAHLGSGVLFHLHSTGCRHYRDILQIPGLAGLELTIEANGPALRELLPMLRQILESSRLILYVDHRQDELAEILPKLPAEGLYLGIPQSFLPTETEFADFIRRYW